MAKSAGTSWSMMTKEQQRALTNAGYAPGTSAVTTGAQGVSAIQQAINQSPAGGSMMGASWGNAVPASGVAGGGTGPVGSLSGGGSTDVNAMLADYKAQQAAANAANEARYQDILGQRNAGKGEYNALLDQMSGQSRADALQRSREQAESGAMDIAQRGGGGLAAQAARVMANRAGEEEVRRIDDATRQQRLGVNMGVDESKWGFMERKTEAGPDNAYLSLAERLGSAQAGGSGTMQAQLAPIASQTNGIRSSGLVQGGSSPINNITASDVFKPAYMASGMAKTSSFGKPTTSFGTPNTAKPVAVQPATSVAQSQWYDPVAKKYW